MLQRWYYF